jgi:hypothetical protein
MKKGGKIRRRKVFVFVSVFINCHLDSNFQLRGKWTFKNFLIENEKKFRRDRSLKQQMMLKESLQKYFPNEQQKK